MKYLITGSSGFIGQALTKTLVRKGHQVVPLSREILYKDPALKRFIEEANPDYIVHLASFGNKYDQQDEHKIFKANIRGTWNMLNASKNVEYKAFLNISTSGHILECDSFYGATKMCGEYLVRAFVKKYNKPVVNVRPFSVYGPGDDPNKFIQTAIRCFKNNEVLKLAPGVHDWVYIDDVIRAFLVIIKNIKTLQGKHIDIGTGQDLPNLSVISYLRELMGKPGKITQVNTLRDYDTKSWWADTFLLKSLGWESQVNMEEGLERCIYGN